MIDWFNYYKKMYLKDGDAMIYILYKVRKNPFCKEDIAIKLCNWLDKTTQDRLNEITKKSNKMWNLSQVGIMRGNLYNRFIEFDNEIRGE